MASANRLHITLEPGYAARLSRLARLAGVPEGTIARLLLCQAIEEADPDGRSATALLDGIPRAFERARHSLERGREGETIGLEEL